MYKFISAIQTINDKLVWSEYIKWTLVIAVAVILEAVIVLLAIELIGKRSKRTIVVGDDSAADCTDKQTAPTEESEENGAESGAADRGNEA